MKKRVRKPIQEHRERDLKQAYKQVVKDLICVEIVERVHLAYNKLSAQPDDIS